MNPAQLRYLTVLVWVGRIVGAAALFVPLGVIWCVALLTLAEVLGLLLRLLSQIEVAD